MEVASQCQPGEQNQNLNMVKFVTSQPDFHQEGEVDPALPKAIQIASVSREDDEAREKGLQKMTRHEENLKILKEFLKVSQEKKGGNEGVFLTTSFPSKTDVSAVEERVKKMATALARVSLREWMLTGFSYLDGLEEIFTRSDFLEAFQKNSFKSLAKLILRICDTEDFERFNCPDEIAEESRQFNDKILLPLKRDENPYQLVAKRKMNFDEFPLLREQDVSQLLKRYMDTYIRTAGVFAGVRVLENFGLAADGKICFEEGRHGRFVELARTVLLEHVPVVESIRIHSILDFLVCPCGLAVDEFVQEAVSDAVWNPELEKLLTNDQLNCLADPIAFCFIGLVLKKREVLMSLSGNAIWILVRLRRPSCYFATEVYHLVKIADGLRRFQDHHFINTHHILWAIRLTGLKDLVDKLVKSVGLRNVVEEPAKCPSYFVYKSAQATAEYHGSK
ncbi:hypothetical protein PTKIN_Ptkin01aG0323900 [Pterospermum kingtungense]